MEESIIKTQLNKKLHSQAREVILTVNTFMENEAENFAKTGSLLIPVKQCNKRSAAACGVSESTIKNIRKEKQKILRGEGECSFQTPVKKKRKCTVTDIDESDKCIFRRTVHEFCQTDKQLPTLEKIREKMTEKINFQGGIWSVQKILKSLGFCWKKIDNKRKIVIEQNDIRQKRTSYLRNIKRFREEQRPIVYIDETYILSSHITEKCWFDKSGEGLTKQISKDQGIIIVNAGWEKGFIPNALLILKASASTGDFHHQMNGKNFMKWAEQQLLPNLPSHSVVVFDNAPYHNVEVDKHPISFSKKSAMSEWLRARGISFSEGMLKPELYQLIKLHKPSLKDYVFDTVLSNNGHTALRLPPYHPDLNPIKLVWANFKGYVASRNMTFKIDQVIDICKEGFSRVGANEWLSVCEKVKKIEISYYESEYIIDDLLERFEINLSEESDDSISKSDSSEEDCVPIAHDSE